MEVENNIEQAPTMDISSPALEPSGDNFTTEYSTQTIVVEEGKKSKLLLKVALIGTSALAFLSSCNQTPTIVQPPMEAAPTQLVDSTLTIDNTPEKENITTEVEITAMPTITEEDTVVTMEDNTIMEEDNTVPEKELDDYEALDLMTWEDFKLVDVKEYERGHVVKTTKDTVLYATPLYQDDYWEGQKGYMPLQMMNISPDLYFEVISEKRIQDSKGRELTIANINSLSDTFDDAVLSFISSYKDEEGNTFSFTKTSENSPDSENRALSFSMIEGELLRYVEALVRATENFLKYQNEKGSFKRNEDYYFSELIDFRPFDKDSEFFTLADTNPANSEKFNYTIMQMASIFYRFLSEEPALADVEAMAIGARTMGPLSPFREDSAYFAITPPGSLQSKDIRFSPKNDYYVGVDISLAELDSPFRISYILSFYKTDSPPSEELKKLESLLDAFDDYEEIDYNTLDFTNKPDKYWGYLYLEDKEKVGNIIETIFPRLSSSE